MMVSPMDFPSSSQSQTRKATRGRRDRYIVATTLILPVSTQATGASHTQFVRRCH